MKNKLDGCLFHYFDKKSESNLACTIKKLEYTVKGKGSLKKLAGKYAFRNLESVYHDNIVTEYRTDDEIEQGDFNEKVDRLVKLNEYETANGEILKLADVLKRGDLLGDEF